MNTLNLSHVKGIVEAAFPGRPVTVLFEANEGHEDRIVFSLDGCHYSAFTGKDLAHMTPGALAVTVIADFNRLLGGD